VLVALAGAVLAVIAGFGIAAAVVLDDDVVGTGDTIVISPAAPGSDERTGTDFQLRESMHRR
jgi:hypothetical protein